MASGNIPTLATTVGFDDTNTAGTVVARAADNSIAVGKVNATGIAASAAISLGKRAVTGAVTLDFSASLVSIDATSGAFALTLPLASTAGGWIYFISKLDSAHTVTLTGGASDNIVGTGGSANTLALSTQYATTIIWSDGTRWFSK